MKKSGSLLALYVLAVVSAPGCAVSRDDSGSIESVVRNLTPAAEIAKDAPKPAYELSLEQAYARSLDQGTPIHLDAPIAAVSASDSLKEYWGDVAEGEFDMQDALSQARSLHVSPEARLSAAQILGWDALLRNSTPSYRIVPTMLRKSMNLKKAYRVPFSQLDVVASADVEAYQRERKMTVRQGLAFERQVVAAFEAMKPASVDRIFVSKQFQTLLSVSLKVSLPPSPYWQIVMVNGFCGGLDAHSRLAPRKQIEEMNGSGDKEFAGVGVTLNRTPQGLQIAEVFEGGGAAQAGLKYGDLITGVDGVAFDLSKLGLDDAVSKIRGPNGTTVTLSVVRRGASFEVPVSRRAVVLKNVTSRRVGSSLYVRVRGFNRPTAKELFEQIETVDASTPVIIDLRGNPGGLVSTAMAMTKAFLDPQKTPVLYDLKHEGFGDFDYDRDEARFTNPLVILVDEGSASASELFSSNMKHLNRALIVGKTSFGKGTAQSVIPLGDTRAVYLLITSQQYFTANDFSPQTIGVTPHKEALRDPRPTAEMLETDQNRYFEREMPTVLKARPGRSQFSYTPSETMTRALGCLNAADAEVLSLYDRTVSLGEEAPDFQLTVAEKAVECLTAQR